MRTSSSKEQSEPKQPRPLQEVLKAVESLPWRPKSQVVRFCIKTPTDTTYTQHGEAKHHLPKKLGNQVSSCLYLRRVDVTAGSS